MRYPGTRTATLLTAAACGLVALTGEPRADEHALAQGGPDATTPAPPHPWPQKDHDGSRTRRSYYRGPIVVQAVTTIAADPHEETTYAQPVVHRNGTLYLRVEPLNAETYFASLEAGGSVLEEVPLTRGCTVGPVLGYDGTLYAGCARGVVAFPAGGPSYVVLPSASPVTALVIGSNGTIYATLDEPRDRIVGIHPIAGVRFSYVHDTERALYEPSVALDGTVHVPVRYTPEGLVTVAPNGTVRWRFKDFGWTSAPPVIAVAPDGTVYVRGAYPGRSDLFALAAADGRPIWTPAFDLPDGYLALDAGRLFVGGHTAFDAASGEIHWHRRDWGEIAIGRDGTVYAAGDSTVTARRPTGELLWSIRMPPTWDIGSPILDEHYIAIGARGEVFAVGPHSVQVVR